MTKQRRRHVQAIRIIFAVSPKGIQQPPVNYADHVETFDSSQTLTPAQDKAPYLRRTNGDWRRWGEMREIAKHFIHDQRGSATMEYGLIAAGLSVAIITLLQGIGIRLAGNFAETRGSLR
jgi:pilus assembly protein Flp/PilA